MKNYLTMLSLRWHFFKDRWRKRLCRHKPKLIGCDPRTYEPKTKLCRKCGKTWKAITIWR